MTLFKWNPKPHLVKHALGTRRVFHSEWSRCVRSRKAEIGPKPPDGYWPCYKCFPPCTKRLDNAFDVIVKEVTPS